MRNAFLDISIIVAFILLGIIVRLSSTVAHGNVRNISPPAVSGIRTSATQNGVVLADQQSGGDMGAKIVAANAALGSAKGEIRVDSSGEISEPVVLSENHDLVCTRNQVILTMSTAKAKITQQSNTVVRGCTLVSSQTSSPVGGGEIFSQGTSNVQVEDVTFEGGGYHIAYNTVSNFSIKNTRHLSVTVKGASPIIIDSATHGQINSLRIEGYTVPSGESGIRLVGINKSSFIDVDNPTIRDVDASTVPGCGGLTFTASHNGTVRGGVISGLKNCDGLLTESTDVAASTDIDISGTVSKGHNASPGRGRNANNGEGFDIFNSKRVRLLGVTASDNGKDPSNHQPGIEVSNSSEISISNSVVSDNGVEGIKVDGSPGVMISQTRIDHNGGVGILVMPALGSVSASAQSPIVGWVLGGANVTFSAVWPIPTKIFIGGGVYTIASFQSTTRLTLASDFAGATGQYPYNVDSYVEITGGESVDNGQLSAGLPPDRNAGQR